jgi:putative ABC transport system substrate-binding protein
MENVMSGSIDSQAGIQRKWTMLIVAAVLIVLVIACGGAQEKKSFTIGVVAESEIMNSSINGFKTGMTGWGYSEGKGVTYIYNGPTGSHVEAVDREINNLIAKKVDMLVVLGITPVLRSKQAVAGTNIPVVFIGAPASVVQSGLVERISHPGGNLTGVQVIDVDSKRLELLLSIDPRAHRIYVPYNPADDVSVLMLANLAQAASQQNFELVQDKITSAEEAIAAIENLPADIHTFYRIPSPTLEAKSAELNQAAVKHGLVTVAYSPLDDATLLTLSIDSFELGKQAARLARQIQQGTKPANQPVETAEMFLTINFKTAQAIGLTIPDGILHLANKIIR